MSVLKVTKCKFTQNRPYEAIFCKSLLIFDTDLVLHRVWNYHTLLFRFSTSPHLRVNIRSVTVTRRRRRGNAAAARRNTVRVHETTARLDAAQGRTDSFRHMLRAGVCL